MVFRISLWTHTDLSSDYSENVRRRTGVGTGLLRGTSWYATVGVDVFPLAGGKLLAVVVTLSASTATALYHRCSWSSEPSAAGLCGRSGWWLRTRAPAYWPSLRRSARCRPLRSPSRAGSCCGHRGRWWRPGPGRWRQAAFRCAYTFGAELLFLQLLTNGFLLSFIQVTGIEFFDIGLNLGIDVFQLPVDFSGCSCSSWNWPPWTCLNRAPRAFYRLSPLRFNCRTKWVNALRKSLGLSDRKPAMVRKQGWRPFSNQSSSMFRWHSRARSRRFGSCSGIRRHTIWTDPPGDTSRPSSTGAFFSKNPNP